MKIFSISRGQIVFIHDMIMSALSVPLALYLRLGDNFCDYFEQGYLIAITLGFSILSSVIFSFMRMYWGMWRYASLNDLLTITKAVSLLELGFVAVLFLVNRLDSYPRSAIIINWFVLCGLLGGPRFLYRIMKDRTYELKFEKDSGRKIPVLLYGFGNEADWFIRAVQSGSVANYRVLGIIANKERVGQYMRGIRIIGTEQDLGEVVERFTKKELAPQKLIIAKDELDGEKIEKLFDLASAHGMSLARLPKADDLKSGLTEKVEIKPIAIEDLLRRPQRVLDHESMKGLIFNRSVLITGAGGSIGSELCRQIAKLNPSKMTFIDSSEYNLYAIDLEMAEKYPEIKKTPFIADVRSRNRINQIFEQEKPELVFHAAALKHVPMTEINPIEGILTNSVGTRIIADTCTKHNVNAMVMISTDKAVNPTNVMGATKRLAECYCQALDLKNFSLADSKAATRFVTVRFGNVLGSTGSVVPLFRKQLEQGGPITVTHPDVTRYFMTIKEAVELVLQASSLGSRRRLAKAENEPEYHGKIFVLEMGEPVKIVDLAKQMIRLAGLRPEVDIKIEYTGLRAGEKMFEEIFHGKEPLIPTGCSGILLAEPRPVDIEHLSSCLDIIEEFCLNNGREQALSLLKELIPEFKHD